MKKLLLLFLFASSTILAQGLNKSQLDELSAMVGGDPMELVKKYNLSLTKHKDNFGSMTDYLSGYNLNGTACEVKVAHENSIIKEITIFVEKDHQNFFLETGKYLVGITDEKKNSYKLNHNIYSSRRYTANTFIGLIDDIKNSVNFADYYAIATFNGLPIIYEMFVLEDGASISFTKNTLFKP